MAKGRSIVLTVEPKGLFKEGTAEGSIAPGECLEVDAAVEPTGGRPVYQAVVGAADGERKPVIVAYNDALQGKTVSDSVADGERVFAYAPIPGDELNVLVKASVGALAIGDKLIIEAASGQCIATAGTPEMEPFEVRETITVGGTATLVYVEYTGN